MRRGEQRYNTAGEHEGVEPLPPHIQPNERTRSGRHERRRKGNAQLVKRNGAGASAPLSSNRFSVGVRAKSERDRGGALAPWRYKVQRGRIGRGESGLAQARPNAPATLLQGGSHKRRLLKEAIRLRDREVRLPVFISVTYSISMSNSSSAVMPYRSIILYIENMLGSLRACSQFAYVLTGIFRKAAT